MTSIQRNPEASRFTDGRVEAIGIERSFIVDTTAWTVREVIDPITLVRVLIFTSAGVGRRVRNYPSEWRTLPSEALCALSWSR